jgi:hypothetical protein
MHRVSTALLTVVFLLSAAACDSGALVPPQQDPLLPSAVSTALAGAPGMAMAGVSAVAAGSGTAGAPAMPADLMKAPKMLSQTGLFSDMATQKLAPGVEFYAPKYELWSDGAAKRRWFQLPAGAKIDTSDMDSWKYPVGTKIWKEFAVNGKTLETRFMVKFGQAGVDWVFIAYQWNDAGTDAMALPDGAKDVAGTQHDIPSDLTCLKCHRGMPDGALGFSALQLSHDPPGATLDSLVAAGSLTNPPAGKLTIPGDSVAEKALVYLHANCGSCHNSKGGEAFAKNNNVVFWQSAAKLGSVEQTITYDSLVTKTNGNLTVLHTALERMKARPARQMPPVGTEIVDATGVAAMDAWLKQLEMKFPQIPAMP